MKKSVKPSIINGTVRAPASKSMLQRALAAALLAETPTKIVNPTYSNDARAALRVIQALGAEVVTHKDYISITGGMRPTGDILNCGEAGLSIRMFSPIAALWHEELTLTGEGSLLSRPVTMIKEPLEDLGAVVATTGGCPPLTVKGPLTGGEAQVDGSVSSQLLTGLLMALPKAPKDSRLIVKDLKSTPYIDMTLSLLRDFNVEVKHSQYQTFFIPGKQTYACKGGQYTVEGDWSGAAFLLVAGAIGGRVAVTGLDMQSPQADREIIHALKAAGAEVSVSPSVSGDTVEVSKNDLKAFRFDATHCPDLFPPLAVLASNCAGTTVLTGVERLIHKESNRAAALQEEFSKLGAVIRFVGNRMEIEGGKLIGGTIDSRNDHRIAMAGAVAAINAGGDVTIDDYECTAKSYPDFFADFAAIGGKVYE